MGAALPGGIGEKDGALACADSGSLIIKSQNGVG